MNSEQAKLLALTGSGKKIKHLKMINDMTTDPYTLAHLGLTLLIHQLSMYFSK